MTCSACICELEFKGRIEKVQTVHQNIYKFFWKTNGAGGGISVRLWVKAASSATVNTCLFYWTCVKYGSSMKCLLSVCSVISLFSCLAVNNCIEILLDFSAFLHVARSFLYQSDCETFQTSLLKKQAILNLYLGIIQWPDILGAS